MPQVAGCKIHLNTFNQFQYVEMENDALRCVTEVYLERKRVSVFCKQVSGVASEMRDQARRIANEK